MKMKIMIGMCVISQRVISVGPIAPWIDARAQMYIAKIGNEAIAIR